MPKYKVIALSVFGKGHKIWDAGEIVDGEEFVATARDEGRPEQLVKDGFLELVKEKKKPKVVKPKVGNKKRGPKLGKKREKKIETASESLAESLSET